jgi:trehalose/maltose hydrolase-like predicted phosphorylase
VEYYLARTSDGSTLSGVVHSWVLARLDRARSWDRLRVSLESDVGDIQDGTTREGIHLGAIAGTVDIVQRAHMGLVCATTVCGSTRVCPRSWSASKRSCTTEITASESR